MEACDCGAETTGKWANQHTEGCASLKVDAALEDIRRTEQIATHIWGRIDAVTSKWGIAAGRWERRAGDMDADVAAGTLRRCVEEINAIRPAHMGAFVEKCPACGLKASSGLHRFCTRGPNECPVK